jgi:hypothetical protein
MTPRCEVLLVDNGCPLVFDTVSNETLAREICKQRNRIDRNSQPARHWEFRHVGETRTAWQIHEEPPCLNQPSLF